MPDDGGRASGEEVVRKGEGNGGTESAKNHHPMASADPTRIRQ